MVEAAGGGPNPLLSLLRECVVRIDCDGEFRGSGFFVAPGEVLTCAHVIHGADQIAVSGAAGEFTGQVVGRAPGKVDTGQAAAFHPLPDLALLRLGGVDGPHPIVQLGLERPSGGEEPDLLQLSAYSRGAYAPGAVELDGASVAFEETFGDFGLLKLKDGQVIRGFSGCPAMNLRTGLVCGVVDSTRSESDDLGGFAIPIQVAAGEFPGMIERNAAVHAGRSPWKEAIESERATAAARGGAADRLPLLRPPYQPAPGTRYAPSELLKPRLAVVDLIEREGLQAHLMRWRESAKSLRVLLVTGAGGMGKTRLALEESARADAAGWTAGLLVLDSEAAQNEEIDRLLDWPARLFVAIDYAETRPSFVGALIGRLARRRSGPPVRLVLVCRQAGTREQLEDHFSVGDDRDSILAALRQAEPVALAEHELDSQRLFRAGVEAFAPHVGQAAKIEGHRVSLSNEHFARPLFVLAAAQLRAKDPSIDVDALGRDDLMLKLIDEHESRYWQHWNDSLGTELDAELHPRAVTVAALIGAETEEEALSLVDLVPGLEAGTVERKRQIARWLSHLYGDGKLAEAPAVPAVEPDMLAEALIARECGAHEGLIGSVLDGATDPQLTRALNVLSRVAAGNERLAERIRPVLDERLPTLARRAVESPTADGELASALELAAGEIRPAARAAARAGEEAREGGSPLRGLTARLYELAVARCREAADGDPSSEPALAVVLSNLSTALGGLGRSEEAVVTAEESVARWRELVEQDRERCLPGLISALNNLSNQLGSLGRSEALAAVEEAIELRRELVEQDREAHLPALSGSLNNLSMVLHTLGRDEEALEAVGESVEHRRALVRLNPERYLPELGSALTNLSTVLDGLGRSEEALVAIEEAIELRRELVEENPERHMAILVGNLNNLSTVLDNLGRDEEALEAVGESVEHYRELAEEDPERYLPGLGGALSNLSTILYNLGRSEEALAAVGESVEHRRALVRLNPERYLPELAAALNNLSNALDSLGRSEEALEAVEEALEHYRELVERNPERYLHWLAATLTNLCGALLVIRRVEGAQESAEEAVEHYRELVEQNPGRFRHYLAGSLNNLSSIIDNLGRSEEALPAIEEAVEHYRGLAEQNPERHLHELAGSLTNLSNALDSLGRSEEALERCEEALVHLRRLAERNPERHLRELASALNSLSEILRNLDRDEESMKAIEESVAHFRALAKRNPERHLAELAVALPNLSKTLGDLGQQEKALVAIEGALAEHEGPLAAGYLTLVLAKWHWQNRDLAGAVVAAWEALDHARQANDAFATGQARLFLRSLREEDEAGFDAAWVEGVGDEEPLWLRQHRTDPGLTDLLIEWLRTPSWDDSRAFLEANADALLSPAAEAALEHLIDGRPSHRELRHHLRILKAAREDGIEAPYVEIAEIGHRRRRWGRLAEWIRGDEADSLEFLLDNSEQLLDPECERELLEDALKHPQESAIFERIGLLGLARTDGPTAAYALLEEVPAVSDDTELLRSANDPRALALARLRSGLDEQRPDRQFQHALAAAAAGQALEAEQAIERCRRLLPAWERPDYLRRMDLVAEADPRQVEAISPLRDALLADPFEKLIEQGPERP